MHHVEWLKARTGVDQYYSQLLSTTALVALVTKVVLM